MIHTLKEEINVLIYLIIYGIFIISTYDSVLYFSNHLINKKCIRIIIEIIYCIIQLIIAYIFSYNLADGYIPIYFILLIVVGVYSYILFFKKRLFNILDYILKNIIKHKKLIKWLLVNLIYSPSLINTIKKVITKTVKEVSRIQKKSLILSKINEDL